ncbi:Nup85 nucleoporin-domain-containing protein [Dipodascopsis uninucleata]
MFNSSGSSNFIFGSTSSPFSVSSTNGTAQSGSSAAVGSNSSSLFSFPPSTNQIGSTSSPISSGSFAPQQDNSALSDDEIENVNENMNMVLADAPIARGKVKEWQSKSRTLKFVFSPDGINGSAWIDVKKPAPSGVVLSEETKVYPLCLSNNFSNPDYIEYLLQAHALYSEVSASAENSASKSLHIYAKTFLQIVDSTRRKILESNLTEAYVLCHCMVAAYFSPPDMPRSDAIMDWLNQNDPRPTTDETRDVMTAFVPYNEDEFWNLIHKLALRGLFIQCINCLQQSGINITDDHSRRVFASVINCLETAPRGPSIYTAHRAWRAEAITVGDDAWKINDTRLKKGLVNLCKILRGDTDMIIALSDSWQEATAALFFFHDPAPSRLTEYFNKATETFAVDDTILSESGCAAVMSGDIPKALALAEQLDLCVATHLADLCDRQGLLIDFIDLSSLEMPNFRDWLFIRHGERCCASPRTWFIGLSYLRDVDYSEGKCLIEQSITSVFPESEATLEKLLQVCNELELNDTYVTICMAWSKIQFSRGEVGNALAWLDTIGNILEIRGIIWQVFEDSLITGNFTPDPTLQGYLTSPHACPDTIREFITPYAVYYHFKYFLKEKAYTQAAQYLCSLIQFSYLPGKYFAILLCELASLLSTKRSHALPVNELAGILNALYNWEKDADKYKEGIQFLDYCLKRVKTDSSNNDQIKNGTTDWRSEFYEMTTENVIKKVRAKVIAEISKGFLEGQ